MVLDLIYRSKLGGKEDIRAIRAAGYLEKSLKADTRNQKALADTESEQLACYVQTSWDTSWEYVNTELIDGRWVHHYTKEGPDGEDSHAWFWNGEEVI